MKLRNNSEFTEKNNNKTHKGTVVIPAFPSTIVRLDKDSDFDFDWNSIYDESDKRSTLKNILKTFNYVKKDLLLIPDTEFEILLANFVDTESFSKEDLNFVKKPNRCRNSFWTGIYCAKQSIVDNGGLGSYITFYNPTSDLADYYIEPPSDSQNTFNAHEWNVDLAESVLYLFPSTLRFTININGRGLKYLVFNITPKDKLNNIIMKNGLIVDDWKEETKTNLSDSKKDDYNPDPVGFVPYKANKGFQNLKNANEQEKALLSSWDTKDEDFKDPPNWELKDIGEEKNSESSFGKYDSGQFYQVDRVNHGFPTGGGKINFVGKKREL